MVRAVHTAVKGRARFKVHALHGSDTLRHHIEARLAAIDGVKSATASSITGSILVLFNSGNTVEDIGRFLRALVAEYGGTAPEAEKPGRPASPVVPAAETKSLRRRIAAILPGAVEAQPVEAWHVMAVPEVLARLDASEEEGLTREAALESLRRYGPNALPESKPRSKLSMLFEQFQSLPVALLSVAAGISVATGGVVDAIVIMGVVAINAAIGFATEFEADRTIESLKNLVKPLAHVVREGVVEEVALESVALGDLLVLKPGTFVPADARLVFARNLTVDESALTGESLPVHKTADTLEGEGTTLADRLNMVYMGTLVTGGQGFAVVVAIGSETEIGRLQLLVGEAEAPETPMERQLDVIGNQIVYVGLAICGVVLGLGILRGQPFLEMFKISISLAVAAVPEGLPAVATTTLALGLSKMKREKVLIRQLKAVETLGAVQTICFDKTGTVTENRMTVRSVYAGGRLVELGEGRFWSDGREMNPLDIEEFRGLLSGAVLCSETEVREESGEVRLRGTATECALVRMAVEAGVNVVDLRVRYPLLRTKHRSEDRHFMCTLHDTDGADRLISVKGSPQEVLSMCGSIMRDGERMPLTDEARTEIELQNERMAGDALRVLGFAFIENGDEETFDQHHELVWLGLVGMADPIRKGVKELIPVFHRAGIDTVMITGDQSPTAYAIGKELGLSRGEPLEILDSTHLAEIDSDALRALSGRVHVFSRVSPANKLQIVQALQKAGKVVAMTGDGINDGPALKVADIGVALGCTGTDTAREVADVILENDDLETMVLAVSHGRTIYSNIRKSLRFLLATNFSEIMVMLVASTFGLGFPLSAMQLLWINLISDIFPGLALAMEPPEPDVLDRPPRDPNLPIIGGKDLKRITVESAVISASALGAYGYGIVRYGMGLQANSIAFQSLTLAQLIHAISCRSNKHTIYDRENLPPNRALTLALGGSLALQALTFVVPGLKGLLGVGNVDAVDLLVIGGSSVAPLLLNEATKKP